MQVQRDAKMREIQSNLEFFRSKLPELMRTHREKFALIRHREIIGMFDTALDAQIAGNRLYSDNIYSVQKVTEAAIDLGFFSHAMHMG